MTSPYNVNLHHELQSREIPHNTRHQIRQPNRKGYGQPRRHQITGILKLIIHGHQRYTRHQHQRHTLTDNRHRTEYSLIVDPKHGDLVEVVEHELDLAGDAVVRTDVVEAADGLLV